MRCFKKLNVRSIKMNRRIKRYMKKEFKNFDFSSYKQHIIDFVFTTWVCYKRQFMTDLQRLTVIKTAQKLNDQNVPFVLIYSRLNMTIETEKMINTVFIKPLHVLCLEDVIHPCLYQYFYKPDLGLMDHVRIAVIKYFKKFLTALCKLNPDLSDCLTGNSIMYVDSDVEFISNQFPNLYTAEGLCSYPRLNKIFAEADKTQELSDPKRAFKYVITGQAYTDARQDYALKNRSYKPVIASGENCMICVRYDAIELFKNRVKDDSLIVDFHINPFENHHRQNLDSFYIENHTFIYLQLIKHLKHRNDSSWII
ncbi:hypothetical protein LCDVSa012L [Lymphocystis disease virus 3]|uniref:Uncharacterized protein n=1 Tax=Lymphocystis disease virus 3 TaxID=2560566 RepID=A0A1B2RVT0_9VIRU|nr:hypothetical protein BZK12_gp012 [Lymphocystis disease virus Sa]AOC55096.1 hypothetical protein LCDVSa012L [Lymphocystis disease virus 3]